MSERPDQACGVTGQRPAVVTARRLVAAAVAAQIDGHHPGPGQAAQLMAPRPPERTEPVQQDDQRSGGGGVPVAGRRWVGLDDVEADAVGVDVEMAPRPDDAGDRRIRPCGQSGVTRTSPPRRIGLECRADGGRGRAGDPGVAPVVTGERRAGFLDRSRWSAAVRGSGAPSASPASASTAVASSMTDEHDQERHPSPEPGVEQFGERRRRRRTSSRTARPARG